MSPGSRGLDAELAALAGDLRAAGVRAGTAELVDGLRALGEVDWMRPEQFRGALGATLAKSRRDRLLFDAAFDAFLARAADGRALERGVRESGSAAGGEAGGGEEAGDGRPADGGEGGQPRADLDSLRERLLAALREGDDAVLRDLARLAVATLGGRATGTGVAGIDLQRIRRELGLVSAAPRGGAREEVLERLGELDRDAKARFEALLRRELELAQLERTGVLPPARPLGDLARRLPSGPHADLAAVHRVVAQLRRRLATQGAEARGHGSHRHVDVRRTLRASLQTGGVPADVRYKPRRPRRPELFVLCDVSTSVSSASVFFLSVLHALHDSFRRMRSFVFVERVAEVTESFARERSLPAVAAAISGQAGVADVSGYTDYGRVWSEWDELLRDELHPRATVIVLGDARTNGRDPGVGAFATIAARAGRTFWLNPEPRLYWDHGDSVMSAYAAHCEAHECWTADHLEAFVRVLAR